MRKTTTPDYEFYTRCCDSEDGLNDLDKGQAINEMADAARQITYATLKKHCSGLSELEQSLGYDASLKLEKDWAVSFYKGTYRGARAYYIEHSRIEHIFIHKDDRHLLEVADREYEFDTMEINR